MNDDIFNCQRPNGIVPFTYKDELRIRKMQILLNFFISIMLIGMKSLVIRHWKAYVWQKVQIL